MLILVSNDDGFFTDGIKTLANALRKIGEVWVVAPDREQSAAGHSLTLHRPIRVKRTRTDIHEYAVDGTPTDSVNVAINRLMPRKPDIVVSGINRGANLGYDVTYSGKVAAALEAAILGVPAIVVSRIALTETPDEYLYEEASDYADSRVMEAWSWIRVPRTTVSELTLTATTMSAPSARHVVMGTGLTSAPSNIHRPPMRTGSKMPGRA